MSEQLDFDGLWRVPGGMAGQTVAPVAPAAMVRFLNALTSLQNELYELTTADLRLAAFGLAAVDSHRRVSVAMVDKIEQAGTALHCQQLSLTALVNELER